MTKIFITGATGYIGGDVLHVLVSRHPEYQIACLVRDEERGAELIAAYPNIRVVHGCLDDDKLIEQEAFNSDIVCNFANATHEASVRAQVAGLKRRPDCSPGFLIHTTGSGAMIYDDVVHNRYGESSDKIFNDLEGLPDVLSVPDFAKARGAENAAREAGANHPGHIKSAVVSTASAYGTGRGLVQHRMTAVHQLVRCMLERKQVIQVGAGKAAWRNVHVYDLSNLFLKLVEHAASGGGEESSVAVWGGAEGYYFAENGEHVWSELGQSVVKEAISLGLPCSSDVISITAKEAAGLLTFGQFFWGCNSRVEARRAREALGWVPQGPSLEDELPSIVAFEANKLGLDMATKVGTANGINGSAKETE